MNARKRLTYSVLALAAIIAICGGAALYSVRSLGAQLDESANLTARKILLFSAIEADVLKFRLEVRTAMYDATAGDAGQLEASAASFTNLVAATQQEIDKLKPLLVTEKGKKVVAAMEQGVKEYGQTGRALFDLLNAHRAADAQHLATTSLTPKGEEMIRQINSFMDVQNNYVKNASIESAAAISRSMWTFIILLSTGILVSGLVLMVIRRLNLELRSMAEQLSTGAREVASAAQQVASSSQSLAQGSSEQAAAIEEISSSVEEIAAMTHHNTQSATEAATLMGNAQQTGGMVRDAVSGMASAIGEIHDANGQIGKILRSIDEIAFQTNILALNAAVEAARAGEAGAGFAIVADEVRNLAHRSAQAAKDTAQFVERNIASADTAISRVEAVRSTWQKSGDIRDRVKGLADEIAKGSTEQDRGAAEIARAVSGVSNVTQQTAAQAQEAAAASQQLTSQAGILTSVAEQLEALVGA